MQNSLESHSGKLLLIDDRFEANEHTMSGLVTIKESLEQKGKEIEKIIVMNQDMVVKIEVSVLFLCVLI